MSHYIQDTQAVVKTLDSKYLLFTKGGDNNVSSNTSNKRCTSWWCNGVFESKEAYDIYIDVVEQGDINGGMWQFQSLKNKTFNGFTEYDVTAFKRFDRAFKSAKEIDWNLSDVNEDNITKFEAAIVSLFEANNISLKDQDGDRTYPYICSMYDKDEKYKKGVEKLNRFLDFTDQVITPGYREFCYKWANKTTKECFEDVEFCSELTKYRDSWNGFSYLKYNSYNLTVKHIHALFDERKEKLLDLYERDIEQMLKNYPELFTEYLKYSNFFKKAEGIVLELEKVDKYSHAREALGQYKAFIDGINLDYIKEKKEVKKREKAEAPILFVKTWNSLVKNTYYKTTNTIIARDIENLNKCYATGNVDLSEIYDKCEHNFYSIVGNHGNQYKKNKKIIQELANLLVTKYSELLDKRSIVVLSDYFCISTPKREAKIAATLFD